MSCGCGGSGRGSSGTTAPTTVDRSGMVQTTPTRGLPSTPRTGLSLRPRIARPEVPCNFAIPAGQVDELGVRGCPDGTPPPAGSYQIPTDILLKEPCDPTVPPGQKGTTGALGCAAASPGEGLTAAVGIALLVLLLVLGRD